MIVRAATAVSFPVLFSSGHPDDGVDWEVHDPNGVLLDSGTLVAPEDAVSTVLTVPAEANVLDDELLSTRDVSWTYTVMGLVINGEERYSVEARLPFGVSADGVRAKLGVDRTDLPNNEVPLVSAYYAFQEAVGAERLEAITSPNDRLIVTAAIESLAALALLPTMPVRIASKETSGTNQFQRQKIDWLVIQAQLEGMVNAGYVAIIPEFDVTGDFGPLLILATPDVDPLTGAEASR